MIISMILAIISTNNHSPTTRNSSRFEVSTAGGLLLTRSGGVLEAGSGGVLEAGSGGVIDA